MKRINNKGFTLVELLAVLVILIIILTIAIPSITSSVERNKHNVLNKKIDIIEAQAESYVNLYKNKFNYTDFIVENIEVTIDGVDKKYGKCCINIITRIKDEAGLLTDEDLKDADENNITGFVCYDKNTKKYEYNKNIPSDISEC